MLTKFYARVFVVLTLCICSFSNLIAADVANQELSAAIKKAHQNGVTFKEVNLFTNIQGQKHPNELRDETLLMPNISNIQQVQATYPKAISLHLKADNGREYTLELMRSTPLAYDADLGYIDATGRHRTTNNEKGAHYQGAVAGEDHSFATLSAFANGDVMILFATDEGNFVVGQLEDNSGRFIFYNDKNFINPRPGACGVKDSDYPLTNAGQQSKNKTTAWYSCNKVSIYWEADYETYQYKINNVTLTRNYLIGLFNQVQAMYRNERVAVELKSIYVWTVDDPYDSTSSNAGLTSFKNRWNAVGDTFNGNLAMILAKDDGVGNGGIAFVGVLCSKGSAYAYGDIDASYKTIPTYSWDVDMVTHEHGHNMGSNHTHWCGWMTGAGGICGAIDNCTTLEAGGSCSTCSYQYDNALTTPLWQGTVMSYCHLVTRGKNLANGFGPLPSDKIRTNTAAASCLSSIISVTLTPKAACTIDGSVTLTFNADTIGSSNFSSAPYRFTWSNGPTTQNNPNLKNPGVYSVAIEDSNGCKATFSATVTKDTGPDCWKTGINGTHIQPEYISVYPNPAHSSTSVKYFAPVSTNSELKITDVLGRVVYTQNIATVFGENNVTVSTEGWAKGVYQLQLHTQDTRYSTVKLVVE
jgi:hypothetical protein